MRRSLSSGDAKMVDTRSHTEAKPRAAAKKDQKPPPASKPPKSPAKPSTSNGKKVTVSQQQQQQQAQPTLLRLAAGDAAVTGFFVCLSSVFEEVALMLAEPLGLSVFTTCLSILILALIVIADPLCRLCGGSILNPAQNAAFAIAGKAGGPWAHTTRAVAVMAGAVAGSTAARYLFPYSWQGQFWKLAAGVKPGVSLAVGALTELLLGFMIHIVLLLSLGWRNRYAAYWAPLLAVVVGNVVGAELTGPSMNPAVAFGWWVQFKGHPLEQHLAVFWAAPIAGALLAGWAFQYLQPRAHRARRPAKPKAQ